jgi:hypothetical protein
MVKVEQLVLLDQKVPLEPLDQKVPLEQQVLLDLVQEPLELLEPLDLWVRLEQLDL